MRSLVRNVRSAEPGKEEKKIGKKGKKGRGRKAEKGKGNKKGKKNANKKKRARKGGNKGKGKGGNKKKGNNGKKTRKDNKKGKNGKNNKKQSNRKNKGKGNGTKKNDKNSSKEKGRSGRDSKLLPEFLYNQLWCFDLAMEQVLKSFDNNLVFMPMSGNTSLMYFLLSIMFAGSREVCGGQAAIGRVLRAQQHGQTLRQKCETNPLYKLS